MKKLLRRIVERLGYRYFKIAYQDLVATAHGYLVACLPQTDLHCAVQNISDGSATTAMHWTNVAIRTWN